MENFLFKGFDPSDNLRLKANRLFDRILEVAPSDARLSGNLEKVGDRYHCSLELGSLFCPISVGKSHKFASIALDNAELSLLRKVETWKRTRFVSQEPSTHRATLNVAI